MESIDKFVQCCIKSKNYYNSNGSESGIGDGSGSAIGFADTDRCTGFGEFYNNQYTYCDDAGNTLTTTGIGVGIGSGHSLNKIIIRNHEEIF